MILTFSRREEPTHTEGNMVLPHIENVLGVCRIFGRVLNMFFEFARIFSGALLEHFSGFVCVFNEN